MNAKIASILIKQFRKNATSTFTFDKHSTVYIYSERSFVYIGMSRLWIESSRTTRYGRRNDINFHGLKRIRPIGPLLIAKCFNSIDIEGLGVEIHNDEIYIPNANIRTFVIKCFESFFNVQSAVSAAGSVDANSKLRKRLYRHIY